MTPTQQASLQTHLDALEAKAQCIGWQITAHDCAVTLAHIRAGLLSRAAVECELLRLQHALARNRFEIALAKFRIKANFNPAQPRVPARKPGGGQWTRPGGSVSSDLSAQRRRPPGAPRRVTINGRQVELNLGQELRYGQAEQRADAAIEQVRQRDPNWKPTLGQHETSAEGAIRRLEQEAREAEKRFFELMRDSPGQGTTQATGGARSTADILAPDGRPIGTRFRGADDRTRTVAPAEFYDAFARLRSGASPADPPETYQGLGYGRLDGTTIGLRLDERNGLTMDVLKSDHPLIPRGFKVHRR